MNKQRIAIIFIVAIISFWPEFTLAHRYGSVAPPPIIIEGIEYRAPQYIDRIDYVQAFDHESGQLIWESKVFSVWIDPLSEADVQWIMINKLQYIAGKLVVTNERGDTFSLDPATGKVESGKENILAPFVLVSVPIVFLVSIILTILLIRKILLAKSAKYTSSNDERKIYIYSSAIGGVLAVLLFLSKYFNDISYYPVCLIDAGVGGTFFSGNIIIADMSIFWGRYLTLALLILSTCSFGVFIFSLIGKLIILIKRKTKSP